MLLYLFSPIFMSSFNNSVGGLLTTHATYMKGRKKCIMSDMEAGRAKRREEDGSRVMCVVIFKLN